MTKQGKQFELVVADVVGEMDPSSTVKQGEWIEGPDGCRELDVLIEGTANGLPRRIQIECKDYNPSSRPIGIGIIDALDSKHRDLGIDVSLICSNAGFTEDAKRKARRLGIGLIGVLRENDPRIRYRVLDEVYVRRINVVQNTGEYKFDFCGSMPPQGNLDPEEIRYNRMPVANWLKNRILIFLSSNPVVSGRHTLEFRFKEPLMLALPAGEALTRSIQVGFEISGSWIVQKIEIDASCGLYDWIRNCVHKAPGAGSMTLKNLKFGEGGEPIVLPPGYDPMALINAHANKETRISILDLGGLDIPKNIPHLDEFVVEGGLNPIRSDIPYAAYSSR